MAAPALATVLVVTGEAGVATRTDLSRAPEEFRGRVVDDWTVHLADGRKVALIVTTVPVDGGYMLGLYQLGTEATGAGARVDVWLCEALPATTGQQAREVARHLARAVVHGTLPAAPASAGDRAHWQACIPVVARIVARTWSSQQPRGR